MQKGNTIYLGVITVLVLVVLYLLWSQSQMVRKTRPTKKSTKKKNVSFNDNNNKVYLIDGRLTNVRNNIKRERLRDEMNNLEDEIEELTRQLRNNRNNNRIQDRINELVRQQEEILNRLNTENSWEAEQEELDEIVNEAINSNIGNNGNVVNNSNLANNGNLVNNSNLANNGNVVNDSNLANNVNIVNNGNLRSNSNLLNNNLNIVPELLNGPVLATNLNIPRVNNNSNVNLVPEEPLNVNNIPNELQPEPFMNIEPFDNMEASFSRF